MIPRNAPDAVDYLGPDYPYYAEDGSEAALADALDFARETFGGPVWARARARMSNVAERSAPSMVASDLDTILEQATGIRLPAIHAA